MPREPRFVLPGYPHHVVHRGHNRRDILSSAQDRAFYLQTLREVKEKIGCRLYAFCLMSNHVHLLVNPEKDGDNLGTLMKTVAGTYTKYFNDTYKQSGTAWEGRYRSSVVDSDNYLLACCRYIEMNPVRAGIAKTPDGYLWSSFIYKTGIMRRTWIDADPEYIGLGKSESRRQAAYRELVLTATPEEERKLLRDAVSKDHLTGNDEFREKVRETTGRLVGPGRRGRPRKK